MSSKCCFFSSLLIFRSIYRSWFDFFKYLYAGAVIFYCYSDQNSDKISVHIIQECKWFFAFSEQQKIQINFQRPLVLSLGIKPRTALHDNVMVDEKKEVWNIFRFEWFIDPFNHLFCNHFSRKVVWEIWFEKSGSRNLVREKWLTRKKGGFIP